MKLLISRNGQNIVLDSAEAVKFRFQPDDVVVISDYRLDESVAIQGADLVIRSDGMVHVIPGLAQQAFELLTVKLILSDPDLMIEADNPTGQSNFHTKTASGEENSLYCSPDRFLKVSFDAMLAGDRGSASTLTVDQEISTAVAPSGTACLLDAGMGYVVTPDLPTLTVTNKGDGGSLFPPTGGGKLPLPLILIPTVTIDTTPPAAPSAPDLAAADDSGASNSDNLTNQTAGLTFAGTTEAGATVELFDDANGNGVVDAGESLGTVTADSSGNYTIDAVLTDGVHNLRTLATDPAGNSSLPSATTTVTIDTTPPAAPSAPDLDAADDSGTSNSDNLTSQTAGLTLSGTAEAGATVELFDDANGNGVVDVGESLGTAIANGGGTYSIDAVLAEGVHNLRTIATDSAGNSSLPSATTAVTIDTTAPTATVSIDAISTDSGTAGDFITSDTTLSVSGSNVALGAGEKIQISSDGGTTWSDVVQGTATTWSLVDGTIHNASFTYDARVVDTAGNVGPTDSQAVTILPALGFVINGQAAGDNSGVWVSSAGDVNGDGLADLIVGAVLSDPAAGADAGRSYVVFGKADTTAVDLSSVAAGTGGFVINGQAAGDYSGWSVSTAGDVNGDGLADLIVGAYRSDPAAGADAGRSYVVFGKADGTAVDLSAIAAGTGGFVINGQAAFEYSGVSVSSAGDMNGDGLADLIVGAHYSDPAAGADAGRSYVVFGKADGTAVDLSAIAAGTGGFVINGQAASDNSGARISSAGDVNGDGLADLIVGAFRSDPAAGADAGRSYVVFGKADGTAVDLSAVATGTGGFVINGQAAGDWSGTLVSSAGDVNGDGLADLIVGANYSDPAAGADAGRSYVVFGKADGTAVDLSAIAAGTGGFVINGQAGADQSGYSVSSAGDVNGDGLADLIVGANYSDPAAGADAGRSYVVFGKADGTAVDLLAIAGGTGGFVINGQAGSDQSGYSVSSAGDVNGDGLADLIVGAYLSDPAAGAEAGRSYVVFGKTDTTAVNLGDVATGGGAVVAAFTGTTGADTWAGTAAGEIALGGQGADSLTGNGGVDVLYGGEGNDTLAVNADNIAQLALGVTGGLLARVDGGTGVDTLSLDGAGIALDLTAIANVSAGDPETGSRIASTEKIDLTGTGNNTLTLTAADVRDMSGMNVFNSGNGWVGLGATENRHQLVIDGNAGDTVTLTERWQATGATATHGGNTYAIYNMTSSAAQLLIDTDIVVTQPSTLGFVINGQAADNESGISVSSAGDVNGDGLADLIVGAPRSDPAAGADAGRSYVVFGKADGTAVDLSSVAAGTGGFVINGQAADDRSGFSVSSAGDVNGDGLADLIVGARNSDPAAGSAAGRSYVVFGKADGTAVDLSAVAAGTGGFVINGQAAWDWSGWSVSSAGDVNGDGLADLIVGAIWGDPAAGVSAGRSYVVFGKADGTAVDLSAVAAGTGGFVINGQAAWDNSGNSVSSAGDVNGDGLADLIVGAYSSDPAAGAEAGRSYVVFGKADGTAVDLSSVATGTGGFVINGQAATDISGVSVSAAGDVNGDGLADLIVGAYESDPAAGAGAGRSYVVFGKADGTAVDLSTVAAGTGGFVINGQAADDKSGYSVSSAGDVNGDGLADLIVGAYWSDPAAGVDAGRSYVVFGKTDGTAVDLSSVAAGTGGFVINGQAADDESGYSVSSAGDVNGDGLADLIVGAYWSDPAAGAEAGRSYVIFGKTDTTAVNLGDVATGGGTVVVAAFTGTTGADTWSGTAASEIALGGQGADILTGNGGADVLYGGAGNDTLIVNADNIAKLALGVTGGLLARVDGGTGIDTLSLAGSGITLNLTAIANVSAGNPETGSRIASTEKIDLTGTGNNTLTLTAADVRDMSGMNVFNSGNGWIGLGASENKHQLVIDGNAGDTVTLTERWQTTGATTTNGGNTYAIYDRASSAAQLLIDTDVTVTQPSALGFVINGQAASDYSGISVSSAGDVNGDGLADLIVGAFLSDPAAGANAGRSYVVFGKADGTAVDLSTVAAGTGGFVINGQAASDLSGYSVSSAGDVNGDGLADLIVGAYTSDPAAGANAGRSYVVFGKADGTAVDLSTVAAGTGGFVINGQAAGDQSGYSMSSAGDVNGDGLADLIVGAPTSDPAAGVNAGRSYVVFGKADGTAVNLSAIAAGTGGFVINGQAAGDLSGITVSAAGDVNGDGLVDLIVGAYLSDPAAGADAGRSYVVFGKADGTAVDLSAIAAGTGGFVINGQALDDRSGLSVSSAGDVNGDGLADLIVEAFQSDPAAGANAGRSYVVFGKADSTAVDLSTVAAGTGGFVINGQAAGDWSGFSVSSAGDVNGDGLADLIVGAYWSDPAAGANAGRSYVVFGKADGTAVDLSTVAAGTGGFVINGQAADDQSGARVSSAGDVNGDGLADLIVGAYESDPAAGASAGRSYVVFGKTDTTAVNLGDVAAGGGGVVVAAFTGTTGADAWTGTAAGEIALGGAGNDTLAGKGGADVLYGGAGDDTLAVNADNIAKLALGVTGGYLARVDGGTGIDTLALDGSGITLNLTDIANVSAGDPETGSRIASTEKIDLTGTGNNTLTLTSSDVLDMSGMNWLNSATAGWANGTYTLSAAEGRHQLVVAGDAGDVVNANAAAGWVNAGTVSQGGNDFAVYNSATTLAQLLVDTQVVVNVI